MWKQYLNTNYSVSTKGEVRNDKNGKLLSQSQQQDYKFVNLTIDGKNYRKRVHRLVAEVFIENPENKPYVNHIDGIRYHNNVENLEWVTPQENTQHAVKMGLTTNGKAKPVNQYNLDGELMFTFPSAAEAARQTGCTQSKITQCCQRLRVTTNDYQWRYYDDEIQDVGKVEKKFLTGKKVAQCDDDWNILNIYPSFREAAIAVGGTSSAISRVCSGLNIHHKGYRWKTVEEIVQDID